MEETRPAALFDYDFTLISSESLRLFMPYVLKRHRRAMLTLPRLAACSIPYKLGRLSKERMKTEALRIMRHVPAAGREKLLQDFCSQVLGSHHYPRGLERIRWHRQQGHRLILASASVDTYLREVQRQLGFDILVCTRTDSADRVEGANCYGQEKVNRLRELPVFEHTDWANSWAYSDHISDLPMLLLCGHPVAVNPKRGLRDHAASEGWEILEWW